jgi:ATP-dependent Clp protease adaptor protein ClpS
MRRFTYQDFASFITLRKLAWDEGQRLSPSRTADCGMDDYTPTEFVVHVWERFFNKGREVATRIVLHVHHHGIGECGIYTYEMAGTKVTQTVDFPRKHRHPLQCVNDRIPYEHIDFHGLQCRSISQLIKLPDDSG